MKNRAWLVLLASVLVAILVVAGCSGQETQQGSQDEAGNQNEQGNMESEGTEETPEEVTINFWAAWAEDAGPAQMIEDFESQHPHIKVEYVQFSNTDEGNVRVDTSLLAAQEIDVFFNYNMARFDGRARQGLLHDLSEFVERDGFDVAAELGSVVELDGGIYALPASAQHDAVYINKKRLDAAGLPVPEEWTIEEFAEYARAMTEGEGAAKVFGSTDFHQNYYWTLPARGKLGDNMWYGEDGLSRFDDPAFAASLAFKSQLENEEQVQYPYTEFQSTQAMVWDIFFQEQAAMAVSSVAMSRIVSNTEEYPRDFQVTVAPIPTLEEGQEINYNSGVFPFSYLGLGAGSEHKEAAWTFMKWLTTEGSHHLARVGHLPTWTNTDTSRIVEIMFGDNPEEVIDVEAFERVVLNYGAPSYVNTELTAYNEIYQIHQDEAEKALFRQISIDEAIENMKELADAAIQNQ